MKRFKKIIAWAMISLVIQVCGLLVLDKFVFQQTSTFESKKIELKKDNTQNINVTVSTNAENIEISDNGKYLTYKENDALYIQDTQSGTKNQITTEENGEILYSKWLPKKNILAIAEKVEKDGEKKIQLITYNPSKSAEVFVSEICTYQNNMEIKKISASTSTNVYYIDVYRGGMKSTVYRIDINNDLTKINLQANILGNMEVIPREDRLIYGDQVNKKFFATSPNKQLTFNSNKNLTLLGIDRQSIVYMGELNGDKISSIIYGKVDENTTNWKTITLDAVVSENDLYFNDNSEILVNDNLKGIVKNLTTGAEIEYEGKLVQIKEDFIATVNTDRKLVYKNLNTKGK